MTVVSASDDFAQASLRVRSMTDHTERIVAFIPARAESSRFPGKPLADINGKPMIVRVYDRVVLCSMLHGVYLATDSQEILQAAILNGARGVMTSRDHASGTDRVAEAAKTVGLAPQDVVVNVQGDQPLVDPTMIDEVVKPLIDDPRIPMSTLIYRIKREEEINHPNAVKTVFDREGFALYFSRSTIPFFRGEGESPIYYKHHGIYAYRNDFLQRFASYPQGELESKERLEQLRALEYGHRIKVVVTDKDSIEVDTPEDLERVRDEYGKII